ncbi:MAG: endonuclease/exonuclease/phosphatase family protein, partial [Pseudomonadota bacterium]
RQFTCLYPLAGSRPLKLVLYNICYGIGSGLATHMPVPGAGYLLGNQANLAKLIRFLQDQKPDIVGLVEVDTGSIRSRKVNQATEIAAALGHSSSYETKYGVDTIHQLLPILRKQGNAFLASPAICNERFHYFDTGIKRLIIELELDDVAIFLVHLSLKYRHRHAQLKHLYDLVAAAQKPAMVIGDFNTFWGQDEIYLFMKAAGLRSANVNNLPSFPSNAPRKELDFVLYQDGIHITHFDIPNVQLSDHLPLVCEFEIEKRGQ